MLSSLLGFTVTVTVTAGLQHHVKTVHWSTLHGADLVAGTGWVLSCCPSSPSASVRWKEGYIDKLE